MMPIREDTLDAARAAVMGERPLAYGEPEDNFRRIAMFWNIYLHERGIRAGKAIEPHDVALMLDLLKTARLIASPNHQDSYVDKAGYAACGAEVAAKYE